MKSKKIFLIFSSFFLSVALLISCSDEPSKPSTPTGPAPYISKVTSTTTYPGAGLIIEGGNYGNSVTNNYLILNGKKISGNETITSWFDNRITFIVPDDAKSGELTVHTKDGSSNAISITIGDGTPDNMPVIDYVDIKKAQPGQNIGLIGSNFGSLNGSNFVQFAHDSSKTFSKWEDGKIVVQVPEFAVSGKVFVYVNGKVSNSIDFYVQDPNYVLDMVAIPVGKEFVMGYEEPDGAWDAPKHKVKLTKPFYMSKSEITQKQWATVMSGSNPSQYAEGDDQPVEQVTFLRAVEFCNALSRMERKPECYTITGSGLDAEITCDFSVDGYRLPTEAEWEYACRASTEGDYYGSSLDAIAWYNGNSGDQLDKHHAVMQKQPNDFGLYDMLGNVNEWVWDYYDATYYFKNIDGVMIDPRGPASFETNERVRRGGSAWDGKEECTSGKRVEALGQTLFNYNTGFRVARTKLR